MWMHEVSARWLTICGSDAFNYKRRPKNLKDALSRTLEGFIFIFPFSLVIFLIAFVVIRGSFDLLR